MYLHRLPYCRCKMPIDVMNYVSDKTIKFNRYGNNTNYTILN